MNSGLRNDGSGGTAMYRSAQSASGLLLLTVLSPMAGFAVEMALAWRFGVSAIVDAFRIASVLLVLGQQLLVFQILPHVIVPVFTDYRANEREREAWQVAAGLAAMLVMLTAIGSAVVFRWPEPLVQFLAPGLTGKAAGEAALFLRWFALAYPALVITGTTAGVLQTYGIFWTVPVAQLAGHLLLIVLLGLAGSQPSPRLLAGAVVAGTLLGAGLHAGRTLLLYERLAKRWKSEKDKTLSPQMLSRHAWIHPGVRRALRLALPLIGLFVMAQWAAVVVNREISRGPEGELAAFGYAFKLGLVISLAPLALATVLYPRMAAARHGGDTEFATLGGRALRMALFLGVPLAAIGFALRKPLVAMAFERGAFFTGATDEVAVLFGWLVLGTPAAIAVAYLEKMHYALERMWTPAAVRAGSLVLLTGLAPLAAEHGNATGVAALLSLLALLSAGVLLWLLPRRAAGLQFRELAGFTVQLVALSAGAGWVAAATVAWLRSSGEHVLSGPLVPAVAASAAVALYYSGAYAMSLPEATQCGRFLRWQGEVVWRRCVGSPEQG